MTIPGIILFTAMALGLAMIPSTLKEFVACVKEAFGKEG